MKNLKITLWIFAAVSLILAVTNVLVNKIALFPPGTVYFIIVLAMIFVPILGILGLFLTDALIRAKKRESRAVKTGDKILFVLNILCVLSPFIELYIFF